MELLTRPLCTQCGKTFDTDVQLLAHKYAHDLEKPKHTCMCCGKSFHLARAYRTHLLTHDNKFTCKLCPQNFAYQSALICHVEDAHGIKQAFTCSLCNSVEDNLEAFKEHEKDQHLDLLERKKDMQSPSTKVMVGSVINVSPEAKELCTRFCLECQTINRMLKVLLISNELQYSKWISFEV